VQAVSACIGSTGAVEIFPSYGCNTPILGQILTTSFNKEEVIDDDSCPAHPFITNQEVLDGLSFFKVQLIILNDTSPAAFTDSWPPSN
jgi:hypothetical protein